MKVKVTKKHVAPTGVYSPSPEAIEVDDLIGQRMIDAGDAEQEHDEPEAKKGKRGKRSEDADPA